MVPEDVEAVLKVKYPEWVCLVSAYRDDGKPNIMPAGWGMVTSRDPMMFAVSIAPDRFTHDLMLKRKAWVVAWPKSGQGKAVLYLGTHSGRNEPDKVADAGIETRKASAINAPLIVGTHSQFELEYVLHVTAGDHTIFVGRAVAGHVDGGNLEKLLNFGDTVFGTAKLDVEG